MTYQALTGVPMLVKFSGFGDGYGSGNGEGYDGCYDKDNNYTNRSHYVS